MTDHDFAEPLEQVDRVFVRARGRKLLYFGGCDYHRLSSAPEIVRAVHTGIDRFGLSTAASRKTTGNHPLYELVERRVREFFASPAAVLVSSGYLGNFAVAQALRDDIDHALLDEHCHGSLQDAVQTLGCRISKFKHRDPADLARKMRRSTDLDRTVIVTDGMFAYNGSLASLGAYRSVASPDALLWVDDAHAVGVMGQNGRGTAEFAGLTRERLIQTITFSKAFGVYGGAILCNDAFRGKLIAKSSAISGSTPLPLPFAFGIDRALKLVNVRRRQLLQKRILQFWTYFGGRASPSPIVALRTSDAKRLSRMLRTAGIYPTLIRYPGGPAEGYFRFALSSQHSEAQVTALATLLHDHGATPLNF